MNFVDFCVWCFSIKIEIVWIVWNAGDGAGVGKGRTVAGIIYENFEHGRNKAIWVSVSNDLKYDAERDLKDIGASHIHVHHLNKVNAEIFCSNKKFKIYKF